MALSNLKHLVLILILLAFISPAIGARDESPQSAEFVSHHEQTEESTPTQAESPAQSESESKSESKSDKDGEDKPESSKALKEGASVTNHKITIDGVEIAYTATAGKMLLKDDQGKTKAEVFFVAYTKDGAADSANRPVTFGFNGGPGSASLWLHMGLMGPRRVVLTDDGMAPPPPYQLTDNESCLLDLTDVVMIDPVSTGYSRPAKGESAKQFHGYSEDIESVGEFIRQYITEFERWRSPKFLLGESYGTTRAAGLSGHLQEDHGMFLNGVVLVSTVLDFQTLRFATGNDLPYILFLPTYTATAWYHKQLDAALQADLRKTLDEVEDFARREYTLALMKGSRLTADERQNIVQKLSRYTGLSETVVDNADLRIGMGFFAKELLRRQKRTVGRIDSRFIGIDRNAIGDSYDYDPSLSVIGGPFTGTINDYLRRELQYKDERRYNTFGQVRPWNYRNFTNRFLNAGETLREAMTKNQYLKVFVASGYYDLATPHFAADYTFEHLGLDPSLQGNITFGYYEAGHMMYIHKPSLLKLKKDLQAFYESALLR